MQVETGATTTARRMAWTTRDHDDDGEREDEVIPQPEITIFRPALRDWINSHRATHGRRPFPVKTCALNCPHPPALIRFDPWHPAMAFLCRHHQSEVMILASATATRYREDVRRVLNNLMAILVHIDIEIDREIN